MDITELLTAAVQAGASDLHLKSGNYPMMRVHGTLRPIVEDRRLDPAAMDALAVELLPAPLQPRLAREHEVDFAHGVAGLGRFRCNVFRQRGTIAMVLRVIPIQVSSLDDLELPPVLKTIAEAERGLILLTGTTGSGKSTTLAAMVDRINHTRAAHIMTVEDPIEYLHQDDRSITNQREVEVDTKSFAQALRSTLRQDPDVILVGEMRDLKTIETGLTAAETGHLVMSTVHTLDATETINRLFAVFPPHQHSQIRLQLASVLRAVVSQRLMPRASTEPAAASPSRCWSARPSCATVSWTPNARTSSKTRSPRGRHNTGCRRSTNRSTRCIRAAGSPTTRRFGGRATPTNSKCVSRV